MIHTIPFKVVHPCPRPRAVPPRVATTTTPVAARPCLCPRFLSFCRARPSLRRLLSFIPPSRSRALARSLARTHAHARTCTPVTHSRTHTRTDAPSLSLSLSLCLSHYPPTGSLFLRVTTQWRCHTLAPSSNQCYCFIVPLLLLLLDTRKGDPSIPSRVRERRGRVAPTRLVLPRRAAPRLVSRRTKARAEPSEAVRGSLRADRSPYSLTTHFEINVAVGLRLQMRFNTRI